MPRLLGFGSNGPEYGSLASSHIFMGEILPLMDGLLVAKEEGCQMVKEGVAVARYSSL